MATVSETGAAAFTSPDEAAVQVTAQTTETVEAEDAAEQQETVADSEEDIFSSGEENTDMSFQDEADDAFSSGTAGESDRQQEQIPTVATDTADTEGAVGKVFAHGSDSGIIRAGRAVLSGCNSRTDRADRLSLLSLYRSDRHVTGLY